MFVWLLCCLVVMFVVWVLGCYVLLLLLNNVVVLIYQCYDVVCMVFVDVFGCLVVVVVVYLCCLVVTD